MELPLSISVDKLVQLTSGYSYNDNHNLSKEILVNTIDRPNKDSAINDVIGHFQPASFIGYNIQCR